MAPDVRQGPGSLQPGEPYAQPLGSGSGNGGRFDDHEQRLRVLETAATRIETRMENLATKLDVEGLKTLINEKEASMQRWLIGILLTAIVSLVVAMVRTFL